MTSRGRAGKSLAECAARYGSRIAAAPAHGSVRLFSVEKLRGTDPYRGEIDATLSTNPRVLTWRGQTSSRNTLFFCAQNLCNIFFNIWQKLCSCKVFTNKKTLQLHNFFCAQKFVQKTLQLHKFLCAKNFAAAQFFCAKKNCAKNFAAAQFFLCKKICANNFASAKFFCTKKLCKCKVFVKYYKVL